MCFKKCIAFFIIIALLIQGIPYMVGAAVLPLEQFDYEKNGDSICITGYNGSNSDVVIEDAYIIDGKKIKFHKVRCTDEVLVNPGVVYGIHNGGLLIGAINGSIIVDEIQSEGINKMNAKDFFNGAGKNLVNKMFI